jgi:hypothetical protein
MKIKQIMLILLFALGTNNIHALKSQPDERTDQNSAAEQQSQPQKSATEDRNKPKSSQPPRGFTPSEKIEADSAVSFPVDI